MNSDNYYDRDSYFEKERRKARAKKLQDGITNYAFTKLMQGDKEKAVRAARVALWLENQIEG